jgi:hypothetical protein
MMLRFLFFGKNLNLSFKKNDKGQDLRLFVKIIILNR